MLDTRIRPQVNFPDWYSYWNWWYPYWVWYSSWMWYPYWVWYPYWNWWPFQSLTGPELSIAIYPGAQQCHQDPVSSFQSCLLQFNYILKLAAPTDPKWQLACFIVKRKGRVLFWDPLKGLEIHPDGSTLDDALAAAEPITVAGSMTGSPWLPRS